jgi:hypothetical protein
MNNITTFKICVICVICVPFVIVRAEAFMCLPNVARFAGDSRCLPSRLLPAVWRDASPKPNNILTHFGIVKKYAIYSMFLPIF